MKFKFERNKILIFLLLYIITGCGGAKYSYDFDRGKKVDFKNGKWILNEPYTNYKDNDAYLFAKNEFQKILGDSLFELIELRQTKIIKEQLPLNPGKEELREIKELSNCDFLINIESKIIRDEMGSSAHSSNLGKVTKYNEASTHIQIYDLNKLELISESKSFGIVKETKTPEDKGISEIFDHTTPGRFLALNTIKKLIRKYDKYQKE
ncbi:hypothetical protein GCM10007103_35210 [Salinimicrobium marinum]|uniref:Uncharacterized protein n=1 Tax=Salinimicrobium marinum TaxID=680283 RepID=A0A918SKW5_9FLAO|nr:hypothetical protein [Salinimicrobium marinum]GHA51723.1 hypothetical protein GCM10007103_35210 [Salinimicrobium marinum]